MLEHLPKVWSKDLQHRHHLGTWWICRVSSPTQGCYVRIFLLRSSPGNWCAWKFEKHHSSQIHLFSKYSLSSYSELDLGIQQKISPTPSSKTCSLVSKVGKHMGYWGGATFFESGDGELRSIKNQSTPSWIPLKTLGLWLMYPFSHLRSQKWRWVYPRKICREASCLMETIPQTHAGDSPRFSECCISINTASLDGKEQRGWNKRRLLDSQNSRVKKEADELLSFKHVLSFRKKGWATGRWMELRATED